jgi:aminotransferase
MEGRINPAVRYMDESIIREMTRVAEDAGAVNLAQGFPEMPLADTVRDAYHRALADGRNQYTRTWGDPALRAELAHFLAARWGLEPYDPEDELVVTCGASEAIMATLLALLPRGAAVVIPEPIYENYLPAARLAGAEPRIVPIDPFTGAWDPAALDAACRGAAVLILNTPANPHGKVWSRRELETLAEILERHDVLLVTDETYAFITAPEHPHVAPATVAGLRRRTVTIASFSKTYAVTGWRVGFAAAPAPLMGAIRKVHDFLTVCAPAPAQHALIEALRLPEAFYRDVAATYRRRCALLRSGLEAAGWRTNDPQGSYFLLLDLSRLDIADDRRWAVGTARTLGVAGVPGSAFLWDGLPRDDDTAPDRRGRFLRLSFGKREELLEEAVSRFATWLPSDIGPL